MQVQVCMAHRFVGELHCSLPLATPSFAPISALHEQTQCGEGSIWISSHLAIYGAKTQLWQHCSTDEPKGLAWSSTSLDCFGVKHVLYTFPMAVPHGWANLVVGRRASYSLPCECSTRCQMAQLVDLNHTVLQKTAQPNFRCNRDNPLS